MGNSVVNLALLLVLTISLLTVGDAGITAETGAIQEDRRSVYVNSQYTPHDPIDITYDQGFVDQGWPGNGSECNPYLIQGLSIAYDGPCISISHTSAHFKISDCFFTYADDQNEGTGVSLSWAGNGTVEHCRFVGLWSGLWLTGSNDSIIAFNEIDDAGYADIYLAQSYHCRICNNSLGSVGFHGIQIIDGVDLLVTNNSFHGESYGMDIQSSVDCRLSNNEFEIVGLRISGTEREHFLSNTFEDNIVGTRPIAILIDRSSELIDASSYGQLFLFNSSDCIVENGSFDNRSVGVSLAFCNDCLVRNLNASYSAVYLVELQHCFNTRVTRCHVPESNSAGFRFAYTVGCTLTDCETSCETQNHSIISAPGVDLYCDENTTVARNLLHRVGVVGVGSNNCLILDNDFQGELGPEVFGIFFWLSYDFTIKGNELHELKYGIVFSWGDVTNGTIFNNCIHDNPGYGLMLDEFCEGFRIYNNSFWNNDQGNAMDNGALNSWDDGVSLGNQWDDYTGTGVYDISGSAGSVDHFPRTDPNYTPPTTTTTTTTTTTSTTTTTGPTTGATTSTGPPATSTTGDAPVFFLVTGIGALGATVVVIVVVLRKRG